MMTMIKPFTSVQRNQNALDGVFSVLNVSPLTTAIEKCNRDKRKVAVKKQSNRNLNRFI